MSSTHRRPRLALPNLGRAPASARPGYNPAEVEIGIVHLGLGAFHRAHQAVYTDAALEKDGQWGICGVSPRSDRVPSLLRPQDGLFSVLSRTADGDSVRIIGSVREALHAPGDPAAVVERIAAASTRVVTMTVTEKAYRCEPSTGRLRIDDPETRSDLAGAAPRTVIGLLVAGLAARRHTHGRPMTVVCCDNLPQNGKRVQGLVEQFCEHMAYGPADLASWVADNVRFPSTMVDRIVPATSAGDLDRVADLLAHRDEAAVVAEPFTAWVIEDSFAAQTPDWAGAGAVVTGEVGAHEAVKLRVLNGAHSALAYLGALAGHTYIWQAVEDPALRGVVGRMVREEAAPTLTPPAGVDLGAYGRTVFERFANPAIGHRVEQVAMDGSHKLPQRLLDTARDRLAAGHRADFIAIAVAAWICHVAGWGGGRAAVNDPLGEEFARIGASTTDARELAERALAVEAVFGQDLPDCEDFRESIAEWVAALGAGDVQAALRTVVDA